MKIISFEEQERRIAELENWIVSEVLKIYSEDKSKLTIELQSLVEKLEEEVN